MTTCLDTNACPNNNLYNVMCNFSIGMNEYACNPQTTCMREDGKYDCCANHIVRCIVDAASLRVPTIQPSIVISETNCDQMCTKIDKCYWYEILRTDKLCVENNKEYCCAKNRSDCCSTNQMTTYIVFGCIAGIITIITIAFYRYYVKNSDHKIAAAKDATDVESPGRYKMIIRV